jgi:hypothetical protein
MSGYYVYGHINPITKKFFYIGKGTKYRAYNSTQRNEFWKRTVAKYGYAVVKLVDGLTHDQAIEIEKQYIGKYGLRSEGGLLVNLTYGGQGMSGFKMSQESKAKIGIHQVGRVKSEEEKNKLRIANKGKRRSDEVRQRLSVAHTGKRVSEEAKEKIRQSKLGCNNPNYGKKTWRYGIPMSEEEKRKLSEARKGIKQSEDRKEKSIEALVKAREAQKAKMLKVQCLVSGKTWKNRDECISDLGITLNQFKTGVRTDEKRSKHFQLKYLNN